MSGKVIDLLEAREARRLRDAPSEVLDTHDAVLDISDVVFTADDISYNTTITDDYIIINTRPEDSEEI